MRFDLGQIGWQFPDITKILANLGEEHLFFPLALFLAQFFHNIFNTT